MNQAPSHSDQTASDTRVSTSPLHSHAAHDSGLLHVRGEARYVDDLPCPPGTLWAWILLSTKALAKLGQIKLEAALQVDGVATILTARDIPGVNDASAFAHDEPLLASSEVRYVGQPIACIYAESLEVCRAAAQLIEVEYLPLEDTPIFSIREAIGRSSYHGTPHVMRRGDVDQALADAALRFSGEIDTGGQDHFYLETHAALTIPLERGRYHVYSSTQHPSEVQAKVAELLDLRRSEIVVEAPRMGGGFGGKETQGNHIAMLATLGAYHTGRPVKLWLNRDQDMMVMGKRHPFYSTYEAGFSAGGDLLALKVEATSNGGWAEDLSSAILDRCLFHLDNPYYIPTLHFVGRVARTNLPSNTAFRGFGGPQGAVVIEEVMNRAAEQLRLDPAQVKRRNFYGPSPRNMTPYHQEIIADRSTRIFDELISKSEYAERRLAIEAWNQTHPWVKRGIAYQAVKFGISFTATHLNQAGALVMIYADGSVQLNHGGTEMGQGLHSKMLAICAHELGITLDHIRMMNTATDKVPNTSATAASSGSDLNGQAVAAACRTLVERLRPVAAQCFGCADVHAEASRIQFEGGWVTHPDHGGALRFEEVVGAAYLGQVSLAATGFYRTPDIGYNRAEGRGKPFHYFAYGAAVVEVEVSGLTGEHRVTRLDVLHDVGRSLLPSIDRGQVEGGLIQGLGWLTREELRTASDGRLLTHSPDTYKIPSLGDAPLDFRVDLLDQADQPEVIHGSKAVGEPPFLLGIGVLGALRHAISAYHPAGQVEALPIPCTPEAVLSSIAVARGTLSADEALARSRG